VRALLRALANVFRLLLSPFWLCARWLSRPKAEWVVLHLQPRIVQLRPRQTLFRRLLARAPELRASSIEELRELVDALVSDRSIRGVLVYMPALEAAWATCESVRDALTAIRESGKQVVCYASEGGGNRELFVALAADKIFTAPFSAFGPLGLASRPLYVRSLLDKLGIEVQAQACGEYKSAAEPALRDTLSEPAREQLDALLASMHRALETALRERRGLPAERVAELFSRGLLRASEAHSAGVIDGVAYEDELLERLGLAPASDAKIQKSGHARLLDAAGYVRRRAARIWRPIRVPPCIAVVPLRGTITGDRGGLGGTSLRHAQLAAVLRGVKADPRARAVVLYIDSPGGSALASELIHREVERLARVKPVVAYFGDVAASGGYYIGCACARVVAQPLTITGSIGVVSAKFAVPKLFARLGVHPQLLRTAPSADMFSFARVLTGTEEGVMQAHADELYQRFLTVVANGRKRAVAEIEPLARGRVWIGRDAHERGLVDVLGGLDRALEEARSLLGELSSEARSALKARVYVGKANPSTSTGPEQAALWLADQLGARSELELLHASRHEAFQYYAAFAAGFER
jgi:protease-4